MKLASIFPPEKPPSERLDYSTIEAISERLIEAAEQLAAMNERVALARQVREYSGDRLKRSLALAVREFLHEGSATAAETKGRASVAYGEALVQQAEQFSEAERIIAEHDAARIKWESARSLLSCMRQIAANV